MTTTISPDFHYPDSPTYETLRRRFFSAGVPPRYPAVIVQPKNAEGVVAAVNRANELNLPIGVRSGGHLMSCSQLLPGGMLIDMKAVNSTLEYDEDGQTITYGPGVLVREALEALEKVGRFFPTGHTPSVALGGFSLAGGQGWFMRGWGCTADTWITQIEVVTADGEVVLANATENQDLFWAAKGSGQGFFGIATKFWARTISAKSLFHTTFLFQATTDYEEVLAWALEANDGTPKLGTEAAICTFHADKYIPATSDTIVDERIFMGIEVVAYADTINEARSMLNAWTNCPIAAKAINIDPVRPTTWSEIGIIQDALTPCGQGERWQVDSILNNPEVPREQLIRAIKPALLNLLNRRSVGCIYIADTFPTDGALAFSLPHQYYIATMNCWTDPALDEENRQHTKRTYESVEKVGVGMYVADFDASHRLAKVMTDEALHKFLAIRAKWDPKERFPGYKGYASILSGY